MPGRLSVVLGDITTLAVDAIVNAANSALLGGGGVDGAIHAAAGPELGLASRLLAPCPAGQARITPGFQLRARWVIHAVGPVWSGGDRDEDQTLADAYRHSLELAAEHTLRTVAFPSISTGAYRFPVDRAARIAVREVDDFLKAHALPEHVTFVCFDQRGLREYQAVVRDVVFEVGNDP